MQLRQFGEFQPMKTLDFLTIISALAILLTRPSPLKGPTARLAPRTRVTLLAAPRMDLANAESVFISEFTLSYPCLYPVG
jgi:hypothetical protein